ncbi:MAG: hypothetical protein D4R56_02680 [Deltaproteobacteria bacterium]|nr:MAG: hypothetical protein D4R56_02680 [Deltaproteobacteria bacterium]
MALLATTPHTMQPITPGAVLQYIKLEDRLVLLAWLNSLLGYKRNKDLLADIKGVPLLSVGTYQGERGGNAGIGKASIKPQSHSVM